MHYVRAGSSPVQGTKIPHSRMSGVFYLSDFELYKS